VRFPGKPTHLSESNLVAGYFFVICPKKFQDLADTESNEPRSRPTGKPFADREVWSADF
jgi:hypothetical protein